MEDLEEAAALATMTITAKVKRFMIVAIVRSSCLGIMRSPASRSSGRKAISAPFHSKADKTPRPTVTKVSDRQPMTITETASALTCIEEDIDESESRTCPSTLLTLENIR
jgi:hypothetical protein